MIYKYFFKKSTPFHSLRDSDNTTTTYLTGLLKKLIKSSKVLGNTEIESVPVNVRHGLLLTNLRIGWGF